MADLFSKEYLQEYLDQMTPHVGEVWQHYKGTQYLIVAVAWQVSSGHDGKTPVVVYRQLGTQGPTFSRSYKEWDETVTINKAVDVMYGEPNYGQTVDSKTVKRFTRVTGGPING